MKVWLVEQESNVDAEIFFTVVPCATEEVAKEVFKNTKEKIMSEGYFGDLTEDDIKDYCDIEDEENRYFIIDGTDAFYEEVRMYEAEVIE